MTSVEFKKLVAGVGEELTGEKVTQKEAETIIKIVAESVGQVLEQGEEINIAGLGKFKMTERQARTARNPQTGEAVEVPAKSVPTFKVSKALKDRATVTL